MSIDVAVAAMFRSSAALALSSSAVRLERGTIISLIAGRRVAKAGEKVVNVLSGSRSFDDLCTYPHNRTEI